MTKVPFLASPFTAVWGRTTGNKGSLLWDGLDPIHQISCVPELENITLEMIFHPSYLLLPPGSTTQHLRKFPTSPSLWWAQGKSLFTMLNSGPIKIA